MNVEERAELTAGLVEKLCAQRVVVVALQVLRGAGGVFGRKNVVATSAIDISTATP